MRSRWRRYTCKVRRVPRTSRVPLDAQRGTWPEAAKNTVGLNCDFNFISITSLRYPDFGAVFIADFESRDPPSHFDLRTWESTATRWDGNQITSKPAQPSCDLALALGLLVSWSLGLALEF